MAIALDFDFRSNPAANSVEPASRQGVRVNSGKDAGKDAARDRGGEFAALLSKPQEPVPPAEFTRFEPVSTETGGLPAFVAAPLQASIEVAAPVNASVENESPPTIAPATPQVSAEAALADADEVAGSEIATPPAPRPVEGRTELEIDRELGLKDAAEAQAGRPAETGAAPPSRLHSAELAQENDPEPAAAVPAEPSDIASERAPRPESAQALASTPIPAAQPAATVPNDFAAAIVVPPEGRPDKLPASEVPASGVPVPAAKAVPTSKDAPRPDVDALQAAQPVRGDAVMAAPLATFAPDDKLVAGDASPSPAQTVPVTAIASAPAQISAPAVTPAATMAPTQAVLVAAPADIVDIVQRTAADGTPDRVVVQLDPPELGRVSIDFKFDANGLQHVTITSETPEAMRQLRAMHTELMQALERQGLDGQNLSFQHQQQNSQQQSANAALLRMLQAAPTDEAATADPLPAETVRGPALAANGRLDIRL